MELAELCKELNNWFDLKKHFGTFTIEDNELKEDLGLKINQYYRVVGSVFNDGVYQFGLRSLLNDETFNGAIWEMAVPQEVISLLGRINEWEEKYGEATLSPYNSESFGGYSYTKSSGTFNSGESNKNGALSIFANEMNRWRKA